MKYLSIACLLVTSLALVTGIRAEPPVGEKESAPQELLKCPVSGKAVDFSVSAETDDGPVFFCCKRCSRRFQKDPGSLADAVAEQRKALDRLPKVQVTCLISGKPVDKEAFTEIGGQKYYACCEKCIPELESNFDKYKAKLAGSYTYQAKCPVSGKEINPSAFTALEGGDKVYFCCKRCLKAFDDNPAKFAPKLQEQGFSLLAKKAVSGSG
ncbi:MAG: hypothetical protein V3W34_08755 [Phycisphaerae bacterium]